jgi:hypothetical protein
MRHLFLLLLIPACGEILQSSGPGMGSGDDGVDAPPGTTGRCDPSASFQAPVLRADMSTPGDDVVLSLTGDELLAFGSSIDGVAHLAERFDPADDFNPPVNDLLSTINSEPGGAYGPSVTEDGLHMYFLRDGGTFLGTHTQRPDLSSSFDTSVVFTMDGAALQTANELRISRDGQTLYWTDFSDLTLRAASASDPDTFSGERVVSTMQVRNPTLSADELTLFYASGDDVFVSKRSSTDDAFIAGHKVGEVNTTGIEAPLFVTSDDCVLYLTSDRPGGIGGLDIWEARR